MSQRKTTLCSLQSKLPAQLLGVLITLIFILALCNLPANAQVDYNIHYDGRQYQVSSDATDLTQVLDEAGIPHSSTDLVTTSSDEGSDVVSVSIIQRQYVTVSCDGVSSSMLAGTEDTVSEILEHLNIELGEYDQVSHDLNETVEADATITVQRANVSYTTAVSAVSYDSIRVADPDLERGTEVVTTQGVNGSVTTTYRMVQLDGEEASFTAINTETVDPVTEVISYGTKVNFEKPTGLSTSSEYITNIDDEAGTFTTSKGDTYSFSDKLTLEATAYTARSGAVCSTGRLARVGVVAVDPKYIPYGTEMFIMSADGSFVYGLAIAGDCGGAIDNYDVDLYMNSRSNCIQFGRRDVVAYIIDSAESE